jgi:hypothetical protein
VKIELCPDMSSLGAWTCSGWGPDLSAKGYWNLVEKANMSIFSGKLIWNRVLDD